MEIFTKPVHRYMSLVQCPLCRYRYMEEGEACCWDCLPDLDPDAAPEGLLADRERLHAALGRLHVSRLEAEADSGALGSMVGMGFAPSWSGAPEHPAGHPELDRPLPAFATTFASDSDWRGTAEPEPEKSIGRRALNAAHTVHAIYVLLGAAGGAVVLSAFQYTVLALTAAVLFGAAAWVLWRTLHERR